jgi:hypothetical protein
VVPTTNSENLAVTNLAAGYYEACKAKMWNEKTSWIGIELQSNLWMVKKS